MQFETWSGIGALLVSVITAVASARAHRRTASIEDEQRLEEKVERLEARIGVLEEKNITLEKELSDCRGREIDLMRRLVREP